MISFYVDFAGSIKITFDHLDVKCEAKGSKTISRYKMYLFSPLMLRNK